MKLKSGQVEGLTSPGSYGQSAGELRWEVLPPDLGSVPFPCWLLIIFMGCVSGCPGWTVGSWGGGQSLMHVWYHCWSVAGSLLGK